MGYAAILDENLAADATLSGGVWEAALPLAHLLEPSVRETVARCVAGTPDQARFDIVFPAATRWDTLVLSGGTIGRAASYRLSWWADAVDRAPTSLLAGGDAAPFLPVYPPTDRVAARQWHGSNFWRGVPRARDLMGKTPQLIARPTVSPRCRAITVEIDNGGAPLDLGMLFVTRAFRPDWPHDFGMRFGQVNDSPVEAAPAGRRVVDERPAPRRKVVTFRDLTEDEAMRFHDIGSRLGRGGTLLMVEDIRQRRHDWRRVWPATLEAGAVEVRQGAGDIWEAELTLLEIVG